MTATPDCACTELVAAAQDALGVLQRRALAYELEPVGDIVEKRQHLAVYERVIRRLQAGIRSAQGGAR